MMMPFTAEQRAAIRAAANSVADDIEVGALEPGVGGMWQNNQPHCSLGHIAHRAGLSQTVGLDQMASAVGEKSALGERSVTAKVWSKNDHGGSTFMLARAIRNYRDAVLP